MVCGYFSKAQLLIGPTAGGQLSWVDFDKNNSKTDLRMKPAFGYHAGVGVSFRVRSRFFLTSSFLYSTKGKKVEGIGERFVDQKVTYRYIDIPIMYSVDFKANVGKNNQFKYFVGIGPNLSYWLGGKGTLTAYDYADNLLSFDYKIRFNRPANELQPGEMLVEKPNRLQLGLNIAAGVVLEPQPHQKYIFLVRYEFGHSYLSKESSGIFQDIWYQDDLRSRNHGVRLSVMYLIDTKTEERKKGKSTIKKKRMQ